MMGKRESSSDDRRLANSKKRNGKKINSMSSKQETKIKFHPIIVFFSLSLSQTFFFLPFHSSIPFLSFPSFLSFFFFLSLHTSAHYGQVMFLEFWKLCGVRKNLSQPSSSSAASPFPGAVGCKRRRSRTALGSSRLAGWNRVPKSL